MSEDYQPISVHVASAEPGVMPGAAKGKRRVMISYTRVLTEAVPFDEILPQDESRICAWAQAGGANVVISTSQGQAGDPNNQVSGLPYPNGFVLPSTNTAPTPIEGIQRTFATAAAYPAQVTIMVVREAS